MTVDPTRLDAIKARIRALLAKTVNNGCTEGEALAAAAKAFALLRQHGLTEEELTLGRVGSSLGRRRRNPLDDLWPDVAAVCRCQGVLVRGHACGLRYDFLGHQPWPEVADWLRRSLQGAHDRALRAYRQDPAYRRRRTKKTRAAACRQFTVGFVHGVRDKLYLLITPERDEVIRELKRVRVIVQQQLQGSRDLKQLGDTRNKRNTAADREAGRLAGHRTPVNWGVAGVAPAQIGSDVG